MTAEEIVKFWNSSTGSRYPIRDSSISKTIGNLINTFGEKETTDYVFDSISNGKTDLWSIASTYSYKIWKSKKNDGAPVTNTAPSESNANASAQSSILTALSSEIVTLIGENLANKIMDSAKTMIDNYISDKTLIKVVEYDGGSKPVVGVAHEVLEDVIKFVAMNEPVMLVGPAGTGKNVIAKQVADALGLDFYFSNAVTDEYKISGYGDANGKFVETQFYKAFTKGGLFLLDEVDASSPEAMVVLNCAIANGYFDFPVVGRVNANPNFRVIANANTFGTGASMEYVGRNQLDAATLDRFATLYVGYDRRIEEFACTYVKKNEDGEETQIVDRDILEFCRDVRKVSEINGNHLIVSYRELKRLTKMIDIAGMDKKTALKACLFKGMDKDSMKAVRSGLKQNVYDSIFDEVISEAF